MSEKTIFEYLRQGGLSTAGACGMMGNMYCESALRSDNVQDGMGYTDRVYTEEVNNGTITRDSFAHDARGYGLCQWTYYTRKLELWNMTVGKGYSVADERLQCELCLNELKRDYTGLFNYLCSDNCDIITAAKRICSEYERPAVNNYSPRIDAACRYYNKFHDDPVEPDEPADDSSLKVDGICGQATWAAIAKSMPDVEKLPVIKNGSDDWSVSFLQVMLNYFGADLKVDSIFGPLTKNALMEFQEGEL